MFWAHFHRAFGISGEVEDGSMSFEDRIDAGHQLATALAHYKGQKCAVYALPRGGVPVAAQIALALEAPLDVILVRKIGVPTHPELAMGAVVDGGTPVTMVNRQVMRMAGATEADFNRICAAELAEIERRRKLYFGDQGPIDPKGLIAIVVDDGIATGATVSAALHALRNRNPRKLVLAAPVAAPDSLSRLREEADEIVCIEAPRSFSAVGQFYRDFEQVTDAEVIRLLKESRAWHADQSSKAPGRTRGSFN